MSDLHRRSDEVVPRIAVVVAPVAHVGSYLPEGTKNPLTAEEIATEVTRCAEAGATIVHLHVRDGAGTIVSDMREFTRTLDLITERCEVVINGSTGGVSDLSREERCLSVTDPRVELSSLNMGSTNLGNGVYVNTVDDIRYWAGRIYQNGAVPELEIFSSGMVADSLRLAREGVLREPLHFNICLGFPGAAAAIPSELFHLVSLLPDASSWGFLHEGMTSLRLVAAALGLGASTLRVGYEDGGYLRPDRPARSNAELVEQLVAFIRAAGCEPATYEETRRMFALETDAKLGKRQ